MELGEYIKPNGEKGDYQGAFFYSDNGDKLHLRKSIHDASSGQYSVLDLNTGKISSSYIYSCDELIKNKEGIKARCSNKLKSFYDFGVYYNGIGEGLLLFDENNLKIKKIITADNRLDSEFSVDSVSEDKRYILFRKYRKPNVDENTKYIVYDIKDEKVIYSFDTPLTNKILGGFFINRDILVFSYSTEDGLDPDTKLYKHKRHIGIINLATDEKRVLSSGLDEFKHRPSGGGMIAGPDTYNLNSRYIIWQFYSNFYIFDIKEMKMLQPIYSDRLPE